MQTTRSPVIFSLKKEKKKNYIYSLQFAVYSENDLRHKLIHESKVLMPVYLCVCVWEYIGIFCGWLWLKDSSKVFEPTVETLGSNLQRSSRVSTRIRYFQLFLSVHSSFASFFSFHYLLISILFLSLSLLFCLLLLYFLFRNFFFFFSQ